MNNNNWHTKTYENILSELNSSENGLSNQEAENRLKKFGLNKLPEQKPDNPFIIFLRQFQSPLIYILLVASVAVFIIGEIIDSVIIVAVLIFNAIVGSIQEGKAQNTLLALKKFVKTNVNVLRENKNLIILDEYVVPGDIVVLREGEKIAADGRIIFSNNLNVDESALTGESKPSHKISDPLKEYDLPPSEQKNMVFKGTYIVSGNGLAVVVATGISTIIGKIAKEITTFDTEIPLKTNIRYLSRLIIAIVSAISFVLFMIGIFSEKPAKEMFATVVSLAVSIIPEGLPIVMTLVLATGVWRMSKQNALVKKLQAVEALGETNVIAVDKTGTITKNEMIVRKVFVDEKFFEIEGDGYEPKGNIKIGEKIVEPLNHPDILLVGKISMFCSSAHLMFMEDSKQWIVSGDPTEASMAVLAEKIGFNKSDLERESPKIAEIPFDYKIKYHATVNKTNGKKIISVVGAPEVILGLSKKIWRSGEISELIAEKENELESIFIKMSEDGLRVIALAFSDEAPELLTPDKINDLTFVGFIGIKDTVRLEAKESIKNAVLSGIKVIMITGDYKITAQSIAKESGIYNNGDIVLTGKDIDEMSEEELSEKILNASVFARVTPEHKIRIIQSYKKKNFIVAMTGDGVNDAPSLVAADLGVAMGKIGTEVSKEAADIILLDDNLESIILAVEEGRSIYKTIKKIILYLFSTSLGEVLTIAGALILSFPLPILPAQIIWLNFVTDGFLDVALAMEPKEKKLLNQNFRRPKRYFVDLFMAKRMILMALPMVVGTLFIFNGYFRIDIVKAWTMSLTLLAAFQWFNAWNCRFENKSIFQKNFFENKFLVSATIIVIILQIFAVYNPFMQKILKTSPLSFYEWGVIILIASSIVVIEEIRKFFYRKTMLIKDNKHY